MSFGQYFLNNFETLSSIEKKSSQNFAHHTSTMGNFWTKSAKWSLLNMKGIDEDWAEPLTSEDTKQPEDEFEDWLIEWDRENKDRENK
jgi:hypothetical protein